MLRVIIKFNYNVVSNYLSHNIEIVRSLKSLVIAQNNVKNGMVNLQYKERISIYMHVCIFFNSCKL